MQRRMNLKRIVAVLLSVLMLMSAVPVAAGAAETEPGAGEHLTEVPEGYIGIYTIEDLYCVRNDLTANYILMNSIDLSEATAEGGDWSYGGRGWNPIGSDDKYSNLPFSGIFDGNGYSVTGMNINVTDLDTDFLTPRYFGLYSCVSGTVKNLSVSGNIDIKHRNKGYNKVFYIGGIAAECYGIIENCMNCVNFTVERSWLGDYTGQSCAIGGIVGYLHYVSETQVGKIKNCINIGKMSAEFYSERESISYLAGIAGEVDGVYGKGEPVVESCVNTGDIYAIVSGGYRAGAQYTPSACAVRASGIAYDGIISDCYNTAEITTCGDESSVAVSSYSAGISYVSSNLSSCYNVGNISGDTKGVAICNNSSTELKSYFLSGTGENSQSKYVELTAAQMKLKSMYSEWDFDTVWTMEGRSDYPYPELRDVALFFPEEDPFHIHEYTTEITTPATHTATGVMTYKCACGDTYTEEIAKTTEHSHKAVVTASTCTEQGYTTYTCACGDTYVADYVNSLGHSHVGTVTTPATHTATGVKTYKCVCGDTYTEEIAKTTEHSHKAVVTAPTCTEQGYATYTCACGDTYVADYVNSLGHSHVGTVTTPATHTATGVKTYKCVCGDTYTEVIAKIAEHSHKAVVTAPTCTEQGYTTYTCACGDSYVADYTNATGHSHTGKVTKPATHITTGVKTYKCACGDTYTEVIAKTPEHSHTATVTKQATHLTTGVRTYTCACGDTYTTVIPKTTKHTYSAEVLEEAQCKQDGKMLYVCECGHSYTEKIAPLGHVDADDNSECDRCGVKVCDHICHQTGILGIFWKIIRFFWKMCGTNPVCECGRAHY